MSSLKPGIDSSASRQAPGIAVSAKVDDERLNITLEDGRRVSMPLPDWLRAASASARSRLTIEDFGTAIYFEELDEEIGVNEVLGISEDELYEYAGFERGEPTSDRS